MGFDEGQGVRVNSEIKVIDRVVETPIFKDVEIERPLFRDKIINIDVPKYIDKIIERPVFVDVITEPIS